MAPFFRIFSQNRRLWLSIGMGLVLLVIGYLILGRGPDYTVEWTRDVPSKLALEELDPALRDMRTWPIYFHDLKIAHVQTAVEKNAPPFEVPGVGSEILFEIEPRGKEWKRYTVLGKVIESIPGKKIRFALLNESTGKTTRLLEEFEWEVSVRPAEGRWKERGYRSVIHGEARGKTRTLRARFFGRFASRGFLNQIYWVDLVRLANFVENQASWAGDYAPVYR